MLPVFFYNLARHVVAAGSQKLTDLAGDEAKLKSVSSSQPARSCHPTQTDT